MIDYDAIINDGAGETQEPEAVEQRKTKAVGKVSRDLVAVARNEIAVKNKTCTKLLNQADTLVIEDNDGLLSATELQGKIKNASKEIKEAGEKLYKPLFIKYKAILNVVNAALSDYDKRVKLIQGKLNSFATLQENERRKKAQEAQEQAAKLQKKLDDDAAALAKKAKKTAKSIGETYTAPSRIVVNMPVIPKTIEAVTEHGTSKLDPVLVPEITDYATDYIRQAMIDYCYPAFKTLAMQAVKKAIKAGALGINGADGVTVTEKTEVKHRRK